MQVPKSVRRYVACVVVAGLAAIAFAVARWHEQGLGRPWFFPVLLAIVTATELFPVVVLNVEESEALQLEETYLVLMAFVVPPLATFVVLVAAVGLGQTLRRIPPLKIAFNIGQFSVSTAAGLAVMDALSPSMTLTPGRALAVLAGTGVFLILNEAAVRLVIELMEGRPAWRALVAESLLPASMWPANVALGLVGGLAVAHHLWAAPAVLGAIAALRASHIRRVESRRDRERVEGLLSAAARVHASVEVTDVREALIAAARDLLLCRTSRLGAEPPGRDELGAALALEGGSEWLVVSARRGLQGFDETDRHLLEALAAIGATAMRNAELFARLRRTDEHRRLLLSHLVEVREEEKRRIAEDIHDDSVQTMTAASLRLHTFGRHLTDPGQAEELKRVEEVVQLAIARLRRLIFDLRPQALDLQGLLAAVETYLSHRSAELGFAFEVEDRLEAEPAEPVRTLLYRIAQEAMANACLHSGASRVEVAAWNEGGGVRMRVRDDGRGFRPDRQGAEPGHLGLASIRERAETAGGWLRIESAPGAGTTVEFWAPLVETAELPSPVG